MQMEKSLVAKAASMSLHPKPPRVENLDDIKYPALEDMVSSADEGDDIMARINAQNAEKDREVAERAAAPR